jgi:hypothetical protein
MNTCITHTEIAFTAKYCPVCKAEEVSEDLRARILDLQEVVDALSKERDDLAKLMTETAKDNDRLLLKVQNLEDKYVDKQAE